MKALYISLAAAACVLLSTLSAPGVPVSSLNVNELISGADLVTIGAVQTVSERERSTVELSGKRVAARMFRGEMLVDYTLKGEPLGMVQFDFVVPDGTSGYGRVSPTSYYILFLKRRGQRYEFVSPYYPALAAVPISDVQGSTPYERVANALAEVIRSGSVSSSGRRRALYELSTIDRTVSAELLRAALRDRDDAVSLTAASLLLEQNDLTGLPLARVALLEQAAYLPADVVHNLQYGISEGVKNEAAIPSLEQLLQSTDPETRRAAASALRHTRAVSAVPGLTRLLNDPDFEARYFAVIGLAELTGEMTWRPSVEQFRNDERKYLDHWKHWTEKRD